MQRRQKTFAKQQVPSKETEFLYRYKIEREEFLEGNQMTKPFDWLLVGRVQLPNMSSKAHPSCTFDGLAETPSSRLSEMGL